jgi:peptidoglycan/xylan/chitin deacetylase (PgdA/CDA1 family)
MSKDWIKTSFTVNGVIRLAAKLRPPGAAILMYHSVMDDPDCELQTLGKIIHSSTVFSRHMELIAREYVPVSLDELARALTDGKELKPRSVAVTFDDGYRDNCEVAVPILNRVGVPATFYVTVDCVETAKLPWPSRLRHAFYTARKISWNDTKSTRILGDAAQRDQAFLRACDLCAKLAGGRQEEFVAGIENALEAGPPKTTRRLMMTWEQVQEIAKKGHIIGSHTLTHPNMAFLEEGVAKTELVGSKHKLEQVLNGPVVHFSYPCPALSPHWSPGTRRLSQEAGYRSAVTTVGGPVRRNDDPLALHRVRPTKEPDGLRWNLECTFLGRAM